MGDSVVVVAAAADSAADKDTEDIEARSPQEKKAKEMCAFCICDES